MKEDIIKEIIEDLKTTVKGKNIKLSYDNEPIELTKDNFHEIGDLDIKNIDINGFIECIYCNKISKIPKALRY